MALRGAAAGVLIQSIVHYSCHDVGLLIVWIGVLDVVVLPLVVGWCALAGNLDSLPLLESAMLLECE